MRSPALWGGMLAIGALVLALQGNPFRGPVPAPTPVPVTLGPEAGVAAPARSAPPAPATSAPAIDPDRIGPCPESGLPVVRQGRDLDGLDTWWHADGSITKRTVTEIEGVPMPAIVRLRPAGERVRQAGANR